MQKVLSSDLWKAVRVIAKKAKLRQAAVAYLTKDLVGFKRGDTLIVNASNSTVASGETDAKLLKRLFDQGVELYCCRDLHAKVLLLGDTAVVGSGNLSMSSRDRLLEAAIISDHQSTVSAVASFIHQLARLSRRLTKAEIGGLLKIPVSKRKALGRKSASRTRVAKLGSATWMLGIRQLAKDPPEEIRIRIEKTKAKIAVTHAVDEDCITTIKWPKAARFAKECREGDSIIALWRSCGAKRPSSVYAATPVLRKEIIGKHATFYLCDGISVGAEIGWGAFQRLMKKLGYARKIGYWPSVVLDDDLADSLTRTWKTVGASRGK